MARILGNGASGPPVTQETDLVRRLSDPQLIDRALGSGSTRSGTLAGKDNAIYAEVDLTHAPDLNDVRVSHRLGSRPVLVELVEARNAGGAVFPTIMPMKKHRWTPTSARVAVNMNGGTQAGTVLKFRVGGA